MSGELQLRGSNPFLRASIKVAAEPLRGYKGTVPRRLMLPANTRRSRLDRGDAIITCYGNRTALDLPMTDSFGVFAGVHFSVLIF